jgi:threonylcarbamoyladenosine tRNA methylthiotransferase MtaB
VAEYHVENFGCRASHADGDALAAELDRFGLDRAADARAATVVVVNTCCVTQEAERTARAYLRRTRRENPQAKILVTGCYAQRAPQELASVPGVSAVVGNSHKGMSARIAAEIAFSSGDKNFFPLAALSPSGTVPVFADDTFSHCDIGLPGLASSRDTRPNLKVQDGCGHRCSFCIIPFTRGPSRSVPLDAALMQVRRFTDEGGKELVLSGINLGRWGRDIQPAMRLEDLMEAILARTSLPRLRLSSVEPMDWTRDLLALFRQYAGESASPSGPRLARHAHLPLQSGADAILRAMHRRYRPWHYADKVAAIRQTMPEAAIGADVMVGFPGETDALFEESLSFIAQQPFTYLHLFPFSARPGTAAWELHRQRPSPGAALRERMGRLRACIAQKNAAFRSALVGCTLAVVTLKTPEDVRGQGITRAVADNFTKVDLRADLRSNQMLWAHIESISGDGLAAVPARRVHPAG